MERPVVKPEVKKEPEKREPEVKKEEVVIPPVSVVEPTPVVVEPVVVPEPVVETKPVEVEKVVEEVKKEEPKVVETAPVKAEEHKEEKKVETAQAEVTPVAEKAPEDDGVFKIRQPELGAKINVIGQIDLAALNQSTRPKKKSKEEKRREREEKEKIRQDQKKQMKEAIIKEIRREDNKAKDGKEKEADANANKKKRLRINNNKEKVDINNASNFQRGGNDRLKGGGLSDRRYVASKLILEHLKHFHMGIPNSLTRVDHHGFAHQPDVEPFQCVEQFRKLQRREHPVLHHGAVFDEEIAMAFVPHAACRVVFVAERDFVAVVLAATAVEAAGTVQPECQHHAPAPLLLRSRRVGIGLAVGGVLRDDLPFV